MFNLTPEQENLLNKALEILEPIENKSQYTDEQLHILLHTLDMLCSVNEFFIPFLEQTIEKFGKDRCKRIFV